EVVDPLAIGGILTGILTSGAAPVPEGVTGSINSGYNPTGGLFGTDGFEYDDTQPLVFLNMLFIPAEGFEAVTDAHFKYVQVTDANNVWEELTLPEFEAEEPGTVMIYVSNEGGIQLEAYFDDMNVVVDEHPVIQKEDYYPFGLAFNNGYQRVTAKENKYLFGGKELQTALDLGWLDFHARQYDPTIGRFTSVDPLSDFMSSYNPYHYTYNNPINFTDPTGMSPEKDDERSTQDIVDDLMKQADENGGSATWTNPDNSSSSSNGGCPPGQRCETDKDGHTSVLDDDGNVLYVIPKVTESDMAFDAMAQTGDLLKDAAIGVATETVLFFVGEWAFVKTLQAGKWVYRFIKAKNAGVALNSSVAKVLGSSYKAMGEVSVPIKNTDLLKVLNKAAKGNWVKVYEAGIKNGSKIETHYFRNSRTGQVFDVKVKYNKWHQKAFKSLTE
ncbi:MAG: RHS repeat-associated core domain-containing protein, partial [Fulvivirga sp.]